MGERAGHASFVRLPCAKRAAMPHIQLGLRLECKKRPTRMPLLCSSCAARRRRRPPPLSPPIASHSLPASAEGNQIFVVVRRGKEYPPKVCDCR